MDGRNRRPRPKRDAGAPKLALLRLLRLPLYLKLVMANVVFAGLAVVAGVHAVRAPGPGALAVAVVVVVLSVAVNAVIVRIALQPVVRLQEAATRVAAGDLDMRAPGSPIADGAMTRLIETFNRGLDAVAENRRRMRRSASREMKAAEDERLRISRDLHDGIAQELAAARLRLRLARSTTDPELHESRLAQLSEDLGSMIEEVRAIALGLRPPAIDVLGIGPALESLTRSVARTGGLDADVRTDLPAGSLAAEAELALYRILQEALGNVVRHADARHVQVSLERVNGNVRMYVEDDGRGFDAADRLAAPDSLGLFGMKERAAHVGGRVQVSSEPGRGTRVVVSLPRCEVAR